MFSTCIKLFSCELSVLFLLCKDERPRAVPLEQSIFADQMVFSSAKGWLCYPLLPPLPPLLLYATSYIFWCSFIRCYKCYTIFVLTLSISFSSFFLLCFFLFIFSLSLSLFVFLFIFQSFIFHFLYLSFCPSSLSLFCVKILNTAWLPLVAIGTGT